MPADHLTSPRTTDAPALAVALRATRQRTLGLIDAWQQARPTLQVPQLDTLNPPLWELGHVGWFQEWWIARNAQRKLGIACKPDHVRPDSCLGRADLFYDSSSVAHADRWHLPLPDLDATLGYLQAVLEDTLALLSDAGAGDEDLYFWRLVLLHEAMHNEASVYMAQSLGVPVPDALARRTPLPLPLPLPLTDAAPGSDQNLEVSLPDQHWHLGHVGGGFAFDNELAGHEVHIDACHIDLLPVSWARYLPFIEATGHRLPPHLKRGGQGGREGGGKGGGKGWLACHFGQWQPLDMTAPAVHLSWDDAQAWCLWAGRRLPTEAEWECAAHTLPGFAWGEVWEWTASAFEPYPGFVAHPYRDYSAPWFGSRRVLRGACAATSAYMLSPRYRNYFTPERRDIFAGFRSVR